MLYVGISFVISREKYEWDRCIHMYTEINANIGKTFFMEICPASRNIKLLLQVNKSMPSNAIYALFHDYFIKNLQCRPQAFL